MASLVSLDSGTNLLPGCTHAVPLHKVPFPRYTRMHANAHGTPMYVGAPCPFSYILRCHLPLAPSDTLGSHVPCTPLLGDGFSSSSFPSHQNTSCTRLLGFVFKITFMYLVCVCVVWGLCVCGGLYGVCVRARVCGDYMPDTHSEVRIIGFW